MGCTSKVLFLWAIQLLNLSFELLKVEDEFMGGYDLIIGGLKPMKLHIRFCLTGRKCDVYTHRNKFIGLYMDMIYYILLYY